MGRQGCVDGDQTPVRQPVQGQNGVKTALCCYSVAITVAITVAIKSIDITIFFKKSNSSNRKMLIV